MSHPLLQFESVNAGYGGSTILQDISFSIGEGEAVALVGRNGAGKSTLLMSVYGVPDVTTGTITVTGQQLDGKKGHLPAARGVSMVPQGKRIFGNLTVEENILLGRASRRHGTWDLDSIFTLFPNLARGRARPGTSLSGGEQQMLAMARALMAEPALLMLDEPTEGLAPVIIDAIVEALHEIRSRGTSLLIVEQHIGMVRRVASRYMALRSGRLVSEGPIERLQDRDVQEAIAL